MCACVFCNHGTSFLEVCCGFVFEMGRVESSPGSESTLRCAPTDQGRRAGHSAFIWADIFRMLKDYILLASDSELVTVVRPSDILRISWQSGRELQIGGFRKLQ